MINFCRYVQYIPWKCQEYVYVSLILLFEVSSTSRILFMPKMLLQDMCLVSLCDIGWHSCHCSLIVRSIIRHWWSHKHYLMSQHVLHSRHPMNYEHTGKSRDSAEICSGSNSLYPQLNVFGHSLVCPHKMQNCNPLYLGGS